MDTSLQLLARFTVGLCVLVLLASVATVGITGSTGGFSSAYPVTAVFDGGVGEGLSRYSDVRIRGVEVGSVESIELTAEGTVHVEMLIQPDVRVPRDVTARVEPLSVFGPRYIAFDVGDDAATGPFLEPGDSIRATSATTELGDLVASAHELLSALDPGAIRTILHSLAVGVSGRGPSIVQAIEGVDRLTTVLHARRRATRQLVEDVRTLADTFRDRGPAIVATARSLARSLPVVSEHEDELEAMLDDATRVSGDTAQLLRDHGDELGPTIAGLDRAAVLLNRRLDRVDDLLGVFDEFFAMIAAVTRLPVDDGSLQVAVDLFLASNLCRALQPCKENVPKELQPLIDLGDLLDALSEVTGPLSPEPRPGAP